MKSKLNKHLVIKVVLENPDDKQLIFEKISNLKGKKNARKRPYFVNDDQTEKDNKIRSYYCDLMKQNADQDEDNKMQIKLHKGRILVNNKLLVPQTSEVSARDILTLTHEELEALHNVKTHDSYNHREQDSEFYCHYMRIRDVTDVDTGYAKMKVKYGDATHITHAYNLVNADGPLGRGYFDDGEEGAGWAMLKEMLAKNANNLAIFTARYYGQRKLGVGRFEIYANLPSKAVQNHRVRMEHIKRAHRLQGSGSQLFMLLQSSLLSETENPQDSQDEEDNLSENAE